MRDSLDLARKVRLHVLNMTSRAGSSHIASAFSMTDLIAVLYGNILKIDCKTFESPDRDRFILSKGHAGVTLYATLAELGFFNLEVLNTYYQNGSVLSGHVSHKNVPGVEFSTGSLGHGLSVATGLAYSATLRRQSFRSFCLMSDGECDEGSNWEAILFAGHHKLQNLVTLVDYNKIQSLKSVDQTLRLEPFRAKWESFGWSVREIDGHDHSMIRSTLESLPFEVNKPSCVIAHTVKGKGVSFMENQVLWHYRSARGTEYEDARRELMCEGAVN